MNEPLARRAAELRELAFTGRTLAAAGLAHPDRPDRAVRAAMALRRWGTTPAGGYATAAARTPDRTALVDERGTLTFDEVHRRTNALARALRKTAGIGPGDPVAILARNHRGFVEATVACSKLGADAIYLNTSFAAPQIAAVIQRERPRALIHDDEFTAAVAETARTMATFVAWRDDSRAPGLDDLIATATSDDDLAPPPRRGRVVILTSGTTGTPRGAARRQPDSLAPAAALIAKIPLKAREPTLIAAPLFHSWGFAHFSLGLALGSTLVLRRRFDPHQTLATLAAAQATVLVVVPVMLQRILDQAQPADHDLSRLKIIAASGSALPAGLAERTMDAFGDILYNLYGSTEVAWVTVATPDDLRAAPGTAGRPPRGTHLRLLDQHDRPAKPGERGRIFAGNELVFDGYTGTGATAKRVVDGLMSTGDVGHLDADGRLFVDGREDEMIVSGAENVFPREVEDLLAADPRVAEAAVVGVPDPEFGQRLKAFVVRAPDREDLDDTAVKALVRDQLAGFKVPREVVFLKALPRNATGKVVKRDLYP